MALRILFVATEVQPYIKVGGLADVAAGLPEALARLGHEVRVLVPATAAGLRAARTRGARPLPGLTLARGTRLLEAPLAGRRARVWLLDSPGFRVRRGTPYQDQAGRAYRDDAARYDELARVAAGLAAGRLGSAWRPEVVHCNEWHTGLVPVHMLLQRAPAASVFTIHNLGYQGLFPAASFANLGLPAWLWHADALEFHGRMNFMKAGLQFSDRLTAVSPGYAREILSPEFGAGLDGVLRRRFADLSGILNGIEADAWNPARDAALASRFDAAHLEQRAPNRVALCQEFALPDNRELLVGMVTRLVPQKGVDLLLAALPALLQLPVRLVVLGSGDTSLQAALHTAARRHPQRLALRLGHHESLAHHLYAGCDALLMPSRFEPCGLSQMYAMRYGALPIARRTGGLADTVEDGITGFLFDAAAPAALTDCVQRALHAYQAPRTWRRIQLRCMRRDFSWEQSARAYQRVYALAQSTRRYA